MVSLTNKVALVTGGGSGVGRAVACRLADEGCRVVVVGRRQARLQETEEQYAGPGSIVAKAADVSARDQVARVVSEVEQEIGPVEILVNNAGANVRSRSLQELSPDEWDSLIRINLNGAFYMIHAILSGMRARGDGLIINISSIAGKRPSSLGGAAYSASKFGLNALSGVVNLEEGRHGIRSSVICPGEINTPILDDRPEPVSEERRAKMLQPEDVAAAVALIASLPSRAHIPELIIKPTAQLYA
jgi:NADP-dependent 3-hydroxy acid dehydrogenase YdfG